MTRDAAGVSDDQLPQAPPEDFFAALIGDGRPLILLTAVALALSGGFAIFLSMSASFLPHDLAYLGMTPEALCRFFGCRVLAFMVHDRLAFGGVLLSVGTLYAWLGLFPLRRGEAWAWWALALSGAIGFGSFLAYLGHGYLDTWHGLATLLLLPVYLTGLARSRSLVALWPGGKALMTAGWAPRRWRSRSGVGRLCLLLTGAGMFIAGGVILCVGMTGVFVPQDLRFIGADVGQLQAINPRLVPLIAHDRTGFGGGLATTGLLVLCVVWKAAPERHAWQALLVGALFGFGSAIGVHYPIGYINGIHLAPAWMGAILFAAGIGLSRSDYGIGPRRDKDRPERPSP